MPIHVKSTAGVIENVYGVHVKDSGGNIQEVQEVHVKDSGGNIRQVFPGVALTGGLITDSDTPLAESRVRFNSDGSISQWTATAGVYTQFHPGEWYVSEPSAGVGANYEVGLISFTGFTPTGPSVGTWTNMGSAVEWIRQSSAGGTRNANMTIGIRASGSTTTLVTAVITLQTVL